MKEAHCFLHHLPLLQVKAGRLEQVGDGFSDFLRGGAVEPLQHPAQFHQNHQADEAWRTLAQVGFDEAGRAG
ncbi:hypothetical protein APY03_4694 [Variovorax sp. WDL1]|nr:hypothetical protein APY03_4694 [Variovorax sp. WDL1]